jgi:MATE family multidrug resistance protein
LQEEASKMVLVAYYIIALPSGMLLAFKLQLGIIGFWFGFTLGVTFLAIYFLRILLKADWQAVANKSAEEMNVFKLLQA